MKIRTFGISLALLLSVVSAACSRLVVETPAEPVPDAAKEDTAAVAAAAAVAAGKAFYEQQQCGACHGEEATSPFDPPPLRGMDASTLLAWMDGSAPHSGGTVPAVTAEDAEDLAAYLASER